MFKISLSWTFLQCGSDKAEKDVIFGGCKRDTAENCVAAFGDLKKSYPTLEGCECFNLKDMGEMKRCNRVYSVLKKHPCLTDPPTYSSEVSEKNKTPATTTPQLPSLSNIENETKTNKTEIKLSNEEKARFVEKYQKSNLRELLRDAFELTDKFENQLASSAPAVQICTNLRSNCQADITCFNQLRLFTSRCTGCDLNLNNYKDQVLCASTLKNLTHFGFDRCICPGEALSTSQFAECRGYQRQFDDLSCVSQTSALSYKFSNVQLGESCYQVYRECLRSPDCLERYLQMRDACYWTNEAPNCPSLSQCHMEISNFYSQQRNLTLVGKALTCDCPISPDSGDCNLQKQTFRPICAHQPSFNTFSKNHCLQNLNDCSLDQSCRLAYNDFTKHCFNQDKEKCLESYRKLWVTQKALFDCKCDSEFRLNLPTNRMYGIPLIQLNPAQVDLCKEIYARLHKPESISTQPQFQIGEQETAPHQIASIVAEKYSFPVGSFVRLYQKNDIDITFAAKRARVCSVVCWPALKCRGIPCTHSAARIVDGVTAHTICSSLKPNTLYKIHSRNFVCVDQAFIWDRKAKAGEEETRLQLVVGYRSTEHNDIMVKLRELKNFSSESELTNVRQNLIELVKEINQVLAYLIGSSTQCRIVLNLAKYVVNEHKLNFSILAISPTGLVTSTDMEHCENVLSLIKSGINGRQPWVRYNPHLSTLESARLEPLFPQSPELKELFDRLSDREQIMMADSFAAPRATISRLQARENPRNRAPNSSSAFSHSFATSLLSVIVLQAFVILHHVQ